MKVNLALLLLAAVASSVHAELVERNWTSLNTYANPPYFIGLPYPLVPTPLPLENYDGYGWRIDIARAGSTPVGEPFLVEHAGTHVSYGWYDGYGFWIGAFDFTAYEGEAVVMRIYNAADLGEATAWSDSLPVVLPDLEGSVDPEDLEITFEFVPEPSSVLLLMFGTGGLTLYRRSKQRRRHPVPDAGSAT